MKTKSLSQSSLCIDTVGRMRQNEKVFKSSSDLLQEGQTERQNFMKGLYN